MVQQYYRNMQFYIVLILLTIYYIIHVLLFIIIIYTSIIYFIDNYNNDLYFLNGERHFEFGSNSISLNTTFTRYDFNFKSTYDYAPVVIIISLSNYNTSDIKYSLISVSKTGFSIGAQTNAPFIGPINYIAI